VVVAPQKDGAQFQDEMPADGMIAAHSRTEVSAHSVSRAAALIVTSVRVHDNTSPRVAGA
jgi:hypothetical protein